MSEQRIDPAEIMAAHNGTHENYAGRVCIPCDDYWPCLPYRLAEALATAQAQVQHTHDSVGTYAGCPGCGTDWEEQPQPVRHVRIGPGRCACGFDAYQIRGVMIDYHDELMNHLSRNR